MSEQPTGSFFVVKRKADEEEVFGGKRVRLLGSYTTKPNEEDIVLHVGRKALGKKRVIIQDFDTNEFKQFISELPEKKPKTKHRYDNDDDDESDDYDSHSENENNDKDNNDDVCPINDRLKDNLGLLKLDNDCDSADKAATDDTRSPATPASSPTGEQPAPARSQPPPRTGLNLAAAESVVSSPRKVSNTVLIVEKLDSLKDSLSLSSQPNVGKQPGVEEEGEYVYDVYGMDLSPMDFRARDDDDEYDYQDYDSDENAENWRGNDYPDEEDNDGNCVYYRRREDASDEEGDYEENPDNSDDEDGDNDGYYRDIHYGQEMGNQMELYGFELDNFRKLSLHDTDDEFRNSDDDDDDDDDIYH